MLKEQRAKKFQFRHFVKIKTNKSQLVSVCEYYFNNKTFNVFLNRDKLYFAFVFIQKNHTKTVYFVLKRKLWSKVNVKGRNKLNVYYYSLIHTFCQFLVPRSKMGWNKSGLLFKWTFLAVLLIFVPKFISQEGKVLALCVYCFWAKSPLDIRTVNI